jgi:integrase
MAQKNIRKKGEGSIYYLEDRNVWVARLSWRDPETKKLVSKRRFGRDKAHAERLLEDLIRERRGDVGQPSVTVIEPAIATFRQIARAYEDHKVTAPKYRGDRKVSGMRSERTVRLRIKALRDYFGDQLITTITVASVEKFRNARLDTPTKNGTERTIASVNRELEVLRAILRFAKNEGHLASSPFEKSSTPLISKADETKRTRVLSEAEEARLLEQCQTPRRKHLYPIVVAALDTGARKGELLALRWSDINALQRRITLRAMTTKTMQTRIVPLSSRFLVALYQMYGKVEKGKDRGGLPVSDDLVFNLRKFQNGWDAACEDAKIEDLRFHDLRATFATRLIARGMPLEEVSKITGHTQLSTLYAHYIRNTSDAVSRATRLLDGGEDEE